MKFEVEEQPKSTVKLTVRISPEEMAEYLDRAAKQLSSQMNVPGFRKGKAPRSVLATMVGPEYLHHEAMEIAVADSYYQAVMKHKLKPISRPQTDIPHNHAHLERDGLTYTALVPVLPEVDLGNYQAVKVKPVTADFSDKTVEETLQQLRKSRAANKDVDRPAAKGDRVEIDFVGTRKGEEFEGGKSENHPLVIGEDSFIPGFADNLVGLAKGAVKKFKIKFPKDYHEASLAGQKVEFTVTMKVVQEVVLPELDDEFSKQFGAKSLADLRERLRDNIKQEKEHEARRETEMAVLDKVLDEAKVEVPDAIIEEELDKMIGEFRQNIEQQGMPYDQYLEHLGKTEEAIRQESRGEAEKRAKLSLVLNAIQERDGIKPSSKEVETEISQQLAIAPDDETKQRIQTDDFKQYVTRILGNRKVVSKLVEKATA